VKVTLFEDGNFRYTTAFTQGKLLIGRNPEAEINLNSTKVSRKHAVLSVREKSLQIEDLGSSNGTRVNGMAIKMYDLHPNDRVTIGNYELNFHLLADDQPKKEIAQQAGLMWDSDWEDTLELGTQSALREKEPTKVTNAPQRRRKTYPPKAG
jgi:pSer/pThr/pTyr-binding forkhead associated (FHA) protein